MKTFTVRDVDRRPSAILDACDRDGAARIKRRDGRTYTVTAGDSGRRMRLPEDFFEQHRARVKRIFPKRLPRRLAREVDKMLAGE